MIWGCQVCYGEDTDKAYVQDSLAKIDANAANTIITYAGIPCVLLELDDTNIQLLLTEKQWKARAFKNIIDAIRFSSGMLCETDIVSCGQRIDWMIFNNKIIYRDIHANKNIAVKIEK